MLVAVMYEPTLLMGIYRMTSTTRPFFGQLIAVSSCMFGMLLGIGNLIFPVRLGVEAGGKLVQASSAFLLTGVLLPLISIIAIVLFNGNYVDFFGRLGSPVSRLFILICMLIIGPCVAMPRTVTLCHELLAPLLPWSIPTWLFALGTVVPVALLAYRPGKLFGLLGSVLGPLKLLIIGTIIALGIWGITSLPYAAPAKSGLFMHALADGYQTLDAIATIFSGSLIVELLTRYSSEHLGMAKAVRISLLAALLTSAVVALIYVGTIYLGAFYSSGLCDGLEGEVLRQVVLRASGALGTILLAGATLIIGLSSLIASTMIVAEYLDSATEQRLGYHRSIIVVLAVTVLFAVAGLTNILAYSRPFISFFYPLIIVTTVCNLLYKWLGFTWIKLPVLVAAVLSAWLIFW